MADSVPLSEATSNGKKAAVVFVWDDHILKSLKDPENRRVSFIHASLLELAEKLKTKGSRLIVRRGDPTQEIPKLARELGAQSVVWADDYDPGPMQRDSRVRKNLADVNVESVVVKDGVIFHRDEILSATGGPFRVYSPYSRAWKANFLVDRDAVQHDVKPYGFLAESLLPNQEIDWSLESLGFRHVQLWLEPGEDAGHKRLSRFGHKIDDYAEARDFPAVAKTSELSVDFRFGTVSIRDAVRLATQRSGEGAEKWLNELIWRDFYRQILIQFPDVVTQPFQKEFAGIDYPGSDENWERWRDGLTGFPLVDAAMRCLNQTGYMHNRLRMVVASFLTKDLLLDYRRGEQWFARQLLDYELASNNGGWQWASSVGCDPQPYFRIFNPILQSKKFDPEGAFIRQWVPELAKLANEDIHFPYEASPLDLAIADVDLGRSYPKPCVDHAVQRAKAVALLESAKNAHRARS